MNRYLLFAAGTVAALALAACRTSNSPQPAEYEPPTLAAPTQAPAAEEKAVAPADPTAAVENPAPAAPVEVRQALEATDPATVELASGGPQLVEFFAFW